jgi:hypothetical protein
MTEPEIEIVFFEVGQVERWGIRRCFWRPGYSRRADGGEQPWRTREECLLEARREGARARFVDRG